MEAETILVAGEVIKEVPSLCARRPQNEWYLRLGHTRLADAVCDLCGVSTKEAVRIPCLELLTRFTSPSPCSLYSMKKSGHNKREMRAKRKLVRGMLNEIVLDHGLSQDAVEKLVVFIESCLPLPSDPVAAISSLQSALVLLKSKAAVGTEARKAKRIEDAARSLRTLRDLVSALKDVGVCPSGTAEMKAPAMIAIDLGLRHHCRHYHGGTVFQCILLPGDVPRSMCHNESAIEALLAKEGVKIAEGGNYSDLVRKNRPPGNFATSLMSQYTSARIPVCCGVRFQIGKIVELAYLNAALPMQTQSLDLMLQQASMDKLGVPTLRDFLGHPMSLASTVQVLVTSMHGMDTETTRERFHVATRLWNEGISAEYLPQSGVALSLTRRFTSATESDSDWSLLELQGACSLLRIPFLVIVQPHQLREKGLVRLRKIPIDTSSSASTGLEEVQLSLDALASTIRGNSWTEESASVAPDSDCGHPHSVRDRTIKAAEVIFVDHDSFISSIKQISKKDARWKSLLKSMKGIKLTAEAFLSSLTDVDAASSTGVPVFAASELSFFQLRDFGTALMRRLEAKDTGSAPATGAGEEMTEKYPKHKRIFKTLVASIDNFMQRNGYWGSDRGTASSETALLTALLYSKTDDRFDMMSLSYSPSPSKPTAVMKRIRSR